MILVDVEIRNFKTTKPYSIMKECSKMCNPYNERLSLASESHAKFIPSMNHMSVSCEPTFHVQFYRQGRLPTVAHKTGRCLAELTAIEEVLTWLVQAEYIKLTHLTSSINLSSD